MTAFLHCRLLNGGTLNSSRGLINQFMKNTFKHIYSEINLAGSRIQNTSVGKAGMIADLETIEPLLSLIFR